MVVRERPVASAIRLMPPRGKAKASLAAHCRRRRSVRSGRSNSNFCRTAAIMVGASMDPSYHIQLHWTTYFLTAPKFSDGTLAAPVAERARCILERLRIYGRRESPQPEAAYRELCRDINDEPLEEAAVQWCHRHPAPIPFLPGPDYGASD